MKSFSRRLKFFVVGITQSPLKTVKEIGGRFLPAKEPGPQVRQLQKIARETPLILQIETINVCNAACIFCGYKSMKRKKGVMSMPLFKKVVKDYANMGGGPVSLTPVGGDALLDPHLIERIKILDAQPAINQISLTTNAIALERYSDEKVRYLLGRLACIQISIGGLGPAVYETMYAVDRFEKVHGAMDRLLRLKALVPKPAAITFAFRTNDWRFEMRFRRKLNEYRRQGIFVSHIWMYANYSGLVKSDETRKLMVLDSSSGQRAQCLYGCISMAICWDGRVTACGCADIEANALAIGNAAEESLSDVWSGIRRIEIVGSFEKGKPAKICRNCSAYLPDTSVFSRRYFRKFRPHQPLPLEFFHQFWGG